MNQDSENNLNKGLEQNRKYKNKSDKETADENTNTNIKSEKPTKLYGIAVSSGVAIGKAFVIKEEEKVFEDISKDKEKEIKRLKDAIETFEKSNEEKSALLNERERKILLSHTAIIKDPFVLDSIYKEIDNQKTAERAVFDVCESFIKMFESSSDKLTQERSVDIKDSRDEIVNILQKKNNANFDTLDYNSIIVVNELTPSLVSSLDREKVSGIIAENGSETSHSAILSRSMEIPAILSVKKATKLISSGDNLAIDSDLSTVFINPSEKIIEECIAKKEKIENEKKALLKHLTVPCITKDSKRLLMYSNAGSYNDVERGIKVNTDGIGLFRTEFLYMDRTNPISEEEQFEIYKKCAVSLKGKPITIRTLDIGGDKNIESLNLKKEENPFLGFRAIRFCLNRDDVFIPQLRAILKASAYGKVRIMLPLITNVEEIEKAKEKIAFVKHSLTKSRDSFDNNIEVGIMVETPSASIISDILIKHCDFFSIGTNDLVQYIMAVDRGNDKVKYLYSPLEPSILRAIKHISDSAREENKEISMCGEQATDEMTIPLLISMLDKFSVNPSLLLKTKHNISKYTISSSKELVSDVLKCSRKSEIENRIKEYIQKANQPQR